MDGKDRQCESSMALLTGLEALQDLISCAGSYRSHKVQRVIDILCNLQHKGIQVSYGTRSAHHQKTQMHLHKTSIFHVEQYVTLVCRA